MQRKGYLLHFMKSPKILEDGKEGVAFKFHLEFSEIFSTQCVISLRYVYNYKLFIFSTNFRSPNLTFI